RLVIDQIPRRRPERHVQHLPGPTRIIRLRAAPGRVVVTVDIGAFDVARRIIPAVPDPGGLVVGGHLLPINRLGTVGQRHLRRHRSWYRWYRDRVRVAEVARATPGGPTPGRFHRGRAVVTRATRRRGRQPYHHARPGVRARLAQGGTSG